MDIAIIIKMVAVGILVGVLNQLLNKAGKEEYTILTTIAGLIVAFMMLIPTLTDLKDALSSVIDF
ncbi:MAG: stage III sporulation protein AC [Oscillospiraceae bacterium]|nr:stage III sporulation protein AC [Oscillospiraceae bacterium]